MLHLLDIPLAELIDVLERAGERSYRATQICEWIWKKQAVDVAEMTTLSKALRETLAEQCCILSGKIAVRSISRDGCEKLLIEWADGERTETVGIPDGDRLTVCVSTQVGCAMGCAFCASGLDGFVRNLTAGEIVEQVFHVQHAFGRRVTNVVFMGQGEPLANYDATLAAVRALIDPHRGGLSARRVTVSTVGLPDAMRALAAEDIPITLAVSLHAATDDLRSELIPLAEHHPLAEIIDAAREFFNARGREVTLEYTLLADVNDRRCDAEALVRLTERLRCNVNLIRYNASPGLNFSAPGDDAIQTFAHRLRAKGVNVNVRRSRGADAAAACGQLRRRMKDQ